MYEHREHSVLAWQKFIWRVARSFIAALVVVAVALGIGIMGYHFIAGLAWIDSLLNASMILGGMGPVDALHSAAAKIFASCYALFAGLVFIGIATLIAAPFAHRLLHRFHIENK